VLIIIDIYSLFGETALTFSNLKSFMIDCPFFLKNGKENKEIKKKVFYPIPHLTKGKYFAITAV
jgi:hypothetical protein